MDIIEFRVAVEQRLAKVGIDSDMFPGLVGGIAQDAITYAGDFTVDIVDQTRKALNR